MNEQKTSIELARETITELREEYASNPETRYSMALCMADAALKEKQEKEGLKPCKYCDGNGKKKRSYDDTDGMKMAVIPSKQNKNGYKSNAWWIAVTFRGDTREFYTDYCPICGRRLTPYRSEELYKGTCPCSDHE